MNTFNHPLARTAAILLILAADLSPIRSAKAGTDDDIHITAYAEAYAVRFYKNQKRHRALAVGPAGVWAAAWNHSTAKQARDAALKDCGATVGRLNPQHSKRKCVLYDIDGKLTGYGAPEGLALNAVLDGPDAPFGRGTEALPAGKAIGTVIMLHGCNGLAPNSGWTKAWENYYLAASYRVFMPDSFADKRDAEVCLKPGGQTDEEVNRWSRVIKLRIAQTRRTIKAVRMLYPDEPIYLHGHSEGGLVVQGIDEKVAGIIVTGADCGFGNPDLVLAPGKTPTLVVTGTKDPFVPAGKSAKSLSRYCGPLWKSGRLTTVSVEGMGHLAAPWWPKVAEAIGKLLKIKPVKVAEGTDNVKSLRRIPPEYYAAPEHKALAAVSDGTYFFDSGFETPNDAEQAALFGCDAQLRWNAFSEPSKKHRCVVLNVANPKSGSGAGGN